MSQPVTSHRAIDVSTDGHTMTIRVPLTLRRIGGRKRVVSPPGATAWMPPRPEINSPLLHALVRAFHWQSLLDDGNHASVNELAKAHGKNASYVAAILRLTLLAPDIVEAILDGRQPETIQLQPLMRNGVPGDWEEQRSTPMSAVDPLTPKRTIKHSLMLTRACLAEHSGETSGKA